MSGGKAASSKVARRERHDPLGQQILEDRYAIDKKAQSKAKKKRPVKGAGGGEENGAEEDFEDVDDGRKQDMIGGGSDAKEVREGERERESQMQVGMSVCVSTTSASASSRFAAFLRSLVHFECECMDAREPDPWMCRLANCIYVGLIF